MTERVTNVHGQPARFINGRATSETFLDLGPAGSKGYLKVEVFVDLDYPEHVTIAVQDFAAADLAAEDLPRVRLTLQGITYADVPFYPHRV